MSAPSLLFRQTETKSTRILGLITFSGERDWNLLNDEYIWNVHRVSKNTKQNCFCLSDLRQISADFDDFYRYML